MMTNKEKYAKEILDIVCNGSNVAIIENKPCKCDTCSCDICEIHKNPNCDVNFAEWCKKEYQEVDWSKISVDTKVYVRDSKNEQWLPRYFAKYDEYTDSVMTYDNGATSWSGRSELTNRWNYAKLAED